MRKLTRYEKKCLSVSKRLKPLSDAQMKWATRNLPVFRVKYRNHLYCSECGGDTDGKLICPQCNAELLESDVLLARHKIASMRFYYGIETTVVGEQAHRHFLVTKTGGVGIKAQYNYTEVSRVFINEKGSEAFFSISTRPTQYIFDSWIEGSEMKIRRRPGSQYQDYRMHINDYIINPRSYAPDWLKKRGYDFHVPKRYDIQTWKKLILGDPFCEWLAKKGHANYLDDVRLDKLKECRREIILADRHNYSIDDIVLWTDMVSLYRRCGKDTKNAKWSRPGDLHSAHDHAVRLDRKRMSQEERARVLQKERNYQKQKHKYFGIVISDGRFTARVISSAAELIEEGKTMHHCVGTYVDRENSLIFTVRGEEGNRIATVEWSIPERRVVQCRGKCNSRPHNYMDIVKLIESGRSKIVAAGKGKAV